jgi:uncharacterized protein YbjT (DUF2867 family)
MVAKQRVLVAGATGYLGKFVVKELRNQGYWVRALSRDSQKIAPVRQYADEVFIGEASQSDTIKGLCKDIDIVFSSLGITRQKDGLTYMDVDYRANRNVLDEALIDNVTKFMYISVLNANKLGHLDIVKAKERFVQELKEADIEHMVIRPNGFFSDMTEFLNMAQRGRVYLIGKGEFRANPIHGADLAEACVEWFDSNRGESDIGGPEILTHNQIAARAFEVLGKKPHVTHIPLMVGSLIIKLARIFLSVKTYGPLEFFMTVLAMDMVAPTYGERTLKEYFKNMSEASKA